MEQNNSQQTQLYQDQYTLQSPSQFIIMVRLQSLAMMLLASASTLQAAPLPKKHHEDASDSSLNLVSAFKMPDSTWHK